MLFFFRYFELIFNKHLHILQYVQHKIIDENTSSIINLNVFNSNWSRFNFDA